MFDDHAVLGFCPVRRFRTGRTFYTDAHSRPAYEQLKRLVLERGTSRLDLPPMHYPEPDYSTPPCRQVCLSVRPTALPPFLRLEFITPPLFSSRAKHPRRQPGYTCAQIRTRDPQRDNKIKKIFLVSFYVSNLLKKII